MPYPHYTICIGRETLQRLARREAVTVTVEGGARITMIDADNFPRELAELQCSYLTGEATREPPFDPSQRET